MQKIDKKVWRQNLGGCVKIEASRSHTCNVVKRPDKGQSMEKPKKYGQHGKNRTYDQKSLSK